MAVSGNKSTGEPTLIPKRKIGAGALAGAIGIVIVYLLNTYVIPTKPLGPEVSSAFTTILTFIIAYIVPPGEDETSV